MTRPVCLMIAGLVLVAASSGCNPSEKGSSSAEATASASPDKSDKKAGKPAEGCGEGGHKNEKMGYCVAKLPDGGGAKDHMDLGQGRSTETLYAKEGPTATITASGDTLDWVMSGLDNVSNFQGNKELERGDIAGGKGKYVVAREDACKCDRITAVVPRGKGTVTCMTHVDTGKTPGPLFDVCKSLQPL